jgi:hypothetical protein
MTHDLNNSCLLGVITLSLIVNIIAYIIQNCHVQLSEHYYFGTVYSILLYFVNVLNVLIIGLKRGGAVEKGR